LISVMSAVGGTVPECWLSKIGNCILVGHDTFFTSLKIGEEIERSRIDLVGAFHDITDDKSRSQILVFHELGVLAVSLRGDLIWRFDAKDIVVGHNVIGGEMLLQFMDSSPLAIDLSTGKPTHSD
jgi:hypothetical protein